MLSNIAALTFFFESFLRAPRRRALLAAGVFYAVWLAGVQTPIEGVFWLTVAIEYQLSLSAMLILAGLLCKPRQTIWSYCALAGLAIAIPGLHELAGCLCVGCLLGGVVAARAQKLESRQWWLCFGLVAFSFVAVIFSPGKSLTFAQNRTPWDVAHVLPYANEAVGDGVNWVINPAVLLYSLCLPFLLWPGEDSGNRSEYLPPRWLALGNLGAMCFVMVEFASAEKTSGYGELPPRAVGWTQFVFWLLLVCVIVIGLPEISQMKFSEGSRIGMSMLLMASLLGSGNFRLAEKDWRGPARPWWESNIARLKQKGSALEFEPLPPKPSLLRGAYLATNTGCWVNRCMAIYLGANTVVSKDPSENPDRCGVVP